MKDTWYLPDHPDWHSEPEYNPDVAGAILCAHQALFGSTAEVAAYAAALQCLQPVLEVSMSDRQRMHAYFIVALVLATEDPPTPALDALDTALELALALEEPSAQTDLLLLRASINRAVLQVPDAVDDLHDCLELLALRENQPGPTDKDRETRLDATLHLAGAEFAVGNYAEANQLLDQAARLLPQVANNALRTALVAWTRALLLRWSGQPELALTQAMLAADTYFAQGEPGAASRIQAIVAEIALDLAERFGQSGQIQARDALLAFADPYIQRALDLARSGNIGSSETMAQVTRARYQLARGDPGDRKPHLGEMAARGWEHQDMAVVAQAYTQLGREFEVAGDHETAIDWYDKTLAVLKESRMTALGVWAQRALWRLSGETRP